MNILLVTSHLSLRSSLIQVLKGNGYQASATNAQIALELVKVNPYDLVLLDVEQPEEESFAVCRRLRSLGYNHPIVLLISAGADEEAIAGLEAGATDYLQKPLDTDRLLATMRIWLRRSRGMGQEPFPEKNKQQTTVTTIVWGGLSLDWGAARVTWEGREVPLTNTEYKLLELFLRNPNRIFTRSAIVDRLWAADAPTERAINTYIKDIRKKLKTAGLTAEILETVYGMGYRLKPVPPPPRPLQPQLQPKIDALRQQFHERLPERLQILEQAAIALQGGQLTGEIRHLAKDEAHKLAGSLATFGYPYGSTLARSLDTLLRADRNLSEAEVQEFVEQFGALRVTLDQDPSPEPSPQNIYGWDVKSDRSAQPSRLLVIDDDLALTQRLMAEGAEWGFVLAIVPDPDRAELSLEQEVPDAILLDLSFPTTEKEGLKDGFAFLQDLRKVLPELPVVVFTSRNSLHDRLRASRLGTKGFLHKPATIPQIFQKVQRALAQPPRTDAKVLIVDDDLETLSLLSALLTPWGLTVITLDDPERFWDVLLDTHPDLVLLDLEMPTVSGLELCKVVRQDAEWGNLPLLVVTAHTDSLFLQQAFAAGADDFITKPVLGAELVTRVLSRVQRQV